MRRVHFDFERNVMSWDRMTFRPTLELIPSLSERDSGPAGCLAAQREETLPLTQSAGLLLHVDSGKSSRESAYAHV